MREAKFEPGWLDRVIARAYTPEQIHQLAETACFHYWNCLGNCDEYQKSMAELARAIGFTSDPATDAEIENALNPSGSPAAS